MPKKLTLEEVKEKLKVVNSNIKIIDTEYIGNKHPMECECLICGTVWKANWNNLSNKSGCPTCYYNSKFISEEEIIKYVTNSGYKFIEFVKRGSLSRECKIKVKCPENHTYNTSYDAFRGGCRCKKCFTKKLAEIRRRDINEVIKFITDNGYSILGEFNYENNKSEFTIMCSEGHVREICYNHLTFTPQCPECSLGRKVRYSEDDITMILDELGMGYMDGFVDTKSPFKYICSCGSEAYNSLSLIRRGVKCPNCSPVTKWDYKKVKELFESFGCKLISTTYVRANKKLEFECSCGRIGFRDIFTFLDSPRCNQCSFEGRSGENSPHWNPNLTDDERTKNRKFKEYEYWRIAVYERDNYTCQCCKDDTGGNLNAHHLDSHDWAKDKRTDVNNGITLCVDCHTDFHKNYGFGNNTKEQFEEYMFNL